jgi:uncharacterized membrane protein YedE/YeeE
MDEFNSWIVFGGLAVGAVFGFLVQRFRFCLVSATGNLLLIGDYRQALAFAAALLTAITGTQLLELSGIVAIADSAYRNNVLDWFGATVGGLIFGVGATLAGGCAARTLVKTMEGSVHSLIALVSFIVTATVTQFGFLEPLRLSSTRATSITLNTDAGLPSVLSLPAWLVLAAVAIGLVGFMYRGWQRSPNKTMVAVGIVVGSLVVIGWAITGALAQDGFGLTPGKPSSITLAGPLARFGYAVMHGRLPALSFAVAFVVGTAVMSLGVALASGQFRIIRPATGMAKTALLGGAFMGAGSMLAYGCNIGQGLTGVSTLSIESLLAVTGMVAGIGTVTRWMEKHS